MNLELIKYHKKQKGDEYEELVAQYYANQGYIVIKNGFIAEKNDKGVDLIAIAPLEIQLEDEIIYRYEVLLIQCKCFEGFGSCIGSTEESIEGTIVSHSAEKIFEAMEKFKNSNYIIGTQNHHHKSNPLLNYISNITNIEYHLVVPNVECVTSDILEYIEKINKQQKNNDKYRKLIVLKFSEDKKYLENEDYINIKTILTNRNKQ